MADHEQILFELSSVELARFKAHIWDRASDECWPWVDAVTHGYGAATIRSLPFRAHRAVYIIETGKLIPDGKDVAHTCHYRRCCNRNHLRLQEPSINRGEPSRNGRHPKRHGFVYEDRVPEIPSEERLRLLRRLLEARFWELVGRREAHECWPWLGTQKYSPNGNYGRIELKCKALGVRQSYLAHRLSYELNVGPIPKGLVVRHLCNNPICVNPNPGHLTIGTQGDNNNDCRIAGRSRGPRGHRSRTHKIPELLVLEIRRRADAGEQPSCIAADYENVTPQNVRDIRARKAWAWL